MNLNAGQLLKILSAVVALLETQGVLRPDGTFDDTKLNDLQEILAVTSGVEAVLTQHGVVIPPKVDAIIKLLPLLAALAGK